MNVYLKKRTFLIIEFLVIGVFFGFIEDLIALRAVSEAVINLRTAILILAVTMPFAIVSELSIDHPKFWILGRLRMPGGD